MQIRHVQPHSIVRLQDGRLGVAPNRANRGEYHILFGSNSGTILKPTDEVEEVELAVKIAHDRLAVLTGKDHKVELPDDFDWPYGNGRRPGCESTNHKHCCGQLWQCTACKRWFCSEEGHADDGHHEVCDDCWYKVHGKTWGEICAAVASITNGFVCSYRDCTATVLIEPGSDAEKKAQLEAAGWGPGAVPYESFWCCPAHRRPPHDLGFAST